MEKQPKFPHKLSTTTTMNKLIDEMEKGKESTQILRNILEQRPRLNINDDGQDFFKALDHHSMVALTSCITSLSLMRGFEVDGSRIGKRKMDHLDDNGSLNGGFKHEDLCGEVSNNNTPTGKDGRGSYKRRKIGERREVVVSQLREDGFGWRKYGQKVILNSKYPRNYYRCTHKFDKKCQATKQVQQISENPTKYRVIYHGNHICNYNILNKSPIIIDDDSPGEHSSTIVLSFAQKNQVNPLLFPTSTTGAVKQECNSSPSVQSAYEDQRATMTGLSSTTLVSEQSDLVSTAENFCETEVEDDYSCMWTDLDPLHDDLFAY